MPESIELSESADAPQVWKRPNSLGQIEAIRGLGGIVSPLLAGFSLATIAVLVTAPGDSKPRLAAWAVLCFSAASVSLLYVMQYSFLATRSASLPTAYLDWQPEARLNLSRLGKLRLEQAADRKLVEIFDSRAGLLYDCALLLFLAGLATMVVPTIWQVLNALTLVVVGSAFVVELIWALGNHVPPVARQLAPVLRWLEPVRMDITPELRGSLDDLDVDELRQMGLHL